MKNGSCKNISSFAAIIAGLQFLSNKIKFVFALMIAGFLFVPVIVQLGGLRQLDDEQFRKQEKRDRVGLEISSPFNSGLLVNLKTLKELPNQIDSWFNDNFGLRNDLIGLCARLQYRVFGKSMDIKRVVAGKNGFLFLGDSSENVLKQSMNAQYFDPYQLEAFIDSLKNIETYLNREGIAFFFVIAPNKHTIYPEYLPERFRKRKYGHNPYEQVIEQLNRSDIRFVDLKRILTDAKKQYGDILYYKTDSHWSNLGAYIGYKAIMNSIAVSFNDITISEIKDYSVQFNQKGYDLCQMANLSWMGDFYAEIYFPEPIDNVLFHDLRTDHGMPQNSNQDNFVETFEYVKITNSGVKNNYTVLLYRDSFSNALSQFFNRSFQKVTYVAHEEIDKTDFSINEMVRKIKPDIVILEIAERFLMYKFNRTFSVDDLLNTVDYRLLFDSDSNGVSVIDINGFDLQRLIYGKSKNIHNVVLEDKSLVIDSSGDDPFIEIQGIDAVAGKERLAIKIDIESPEANDAMQIFYQTTDEPFFSESKSLTSAMNKGDNIIYGKIESKRLNGVIRIDPGRNKGIYRINSLAIRSIDFPPVTSEPKPERN